MIITTFISPAIADVTAYIGVCLGFPCDSVAGLALSLCNRSNIRDLKTRALVLAVVADAVHQVQRQEMAVNQAAVLLDAAFPFDKPNTVDATWAETAHVTLPRNR